MKILLNGQPQFFSANGFEVLTCSADGPEIPALKASGIQHHMVPMTRQITPFRDLVSLFRLILLMRRFRPHIVHTHTPKAGLLGMLAAFICRVPIRLHTVAGLPLMESKGLKRKLLIFTEKLTYRCATAVFPNSSGLLDYIKKHIPVKTPIAIIGKGSTNGIDTAFFSRTELIESKAREIRNEFGIANEDTVFGFVGRIVRDKGIAELIAAFKKLKKHEVRSGRVVLMLIGSFENDLDPLSKEDSDFLHQDADVVLPGFQQDVRPFIVASDIFVFPSYREGFPNVVMQAGALRTPAIVSDINGCNEIIKDRESGLIVPVKDAQALYQAMVDLYLSAAMRDSFAERANLFIRQNFEQKAVWQSLLKVYHDHLRVTNREANS